MPISKSSKHKPPLTHRLLLRAHDPTTADQIHSTKIQHKPLRLIATDDANTKDSRHLRTQHRATKAAATREARRQKGKGRGANSLKKPRPLSAAEKRKLSVYEIPKEELKRWDVYLGLYELWCKYIREILGVGVGEGGRVREGYVNPQNAGAVLASADFHGAMVEVVRCRCVGRVGVKGVVVRDTKFALLVVGEGGRLWTIPKEHTIFRFEVPLSSVKKDVGVGNEQDAPMGSSTAEPAASAGVKEKETKNLVFELHGEQFKNRAAPERAKKQFKMHFAPDL